MTEAPRLWQKAEQHLAAVDPVQKTLVEKYGPCHLQPKEDYFATLCSSIVSQQLATKAAAAIFARFSTFYDYHPSPPAVARTAPEKLRELGLSSQKISYMLDLADKVVGGSIKLDQFPALPDEEIVRELTAVKGIGVWTAQMFLIFALNRPDVLPVDDFGVRKAMMNCYDLAGMPAKAEMERIAAPWRPWRSIASWYLWRSLENK